MTATSGTILVAVHDLVATLAQDVPGSGAAIPFRLRGKPAIPAGSAARVGEIPTHSGYF